MERVKKYLKEFGFTEQEIDNILSNHALCALKEETLLNHCVKNNKYLLSKGYTKEEIIKMIKANPSLYDYNDEILDKKTKDIISLGYTGKEVLKISKRHSSIYSYSVVNMKQKIDDLILLGYPKEEVIKITLIHPEIYSYSIDNIKQKINDIMALGYTKEEVIKMTRIYPTLYGLGIDNIKQKINYLKEINLGFVVLEDTKQLIQSVDLTYARYEYLKSIEVIIDSDNYKFLFYGNKQFTKQFGIEKKKLLETYSYKNRKERGNLL